MSNHNHVSTTITPLPLHDDAALIMLNLHKSHPKGSSVGVKRKFDGPAQSLTRLVSPNQDSPYNSTRLVQDPAMPSLPFLDENDTERHQSSMMQRDAQKIAKPINPLDLLSTVSLQLAPECQSQPHTAHQMPHANDFHEHDHELHQGYRTYPNGSTYLGHFLNTKRHGFGICNYPNGHRYTGLWSNGQRHGLGRMQYADGSFFEGQWMENRQEGGGVFYYKDGTADVALWRGIVSVYGVRWDANRQSMWRIINGEKVGRVDKSTALMIGHKVGVEGVPEGM